MARIEANMSRKIGRFLKSMLPGKARLVRRRDLPMLMRFAREQHLHANFAQRLQILRQMYVISSRVRCPHIEAEILSFISTILSLPTSVNGFLVEAGCFKGGSTAKFSLAAELAHRDLVVFDSFCGLPTHSESHDKTIYGAQIGLRSGAYSGALEEVKANVAKFGKIERCRFIQGWFDDTMPHFHEPIAAAYVDVDLVSSTKTCLKYLFPLLQPGGVLFSQDGHLPLVIDVFDDDSFWENEVGCKKPQIIGLGESKLIKVTKRADLGPSTQEREAPSISSI
jgi:O-methyltransferase